MADAWLQIVEGAAHDGAALRASVRLAIDEAKVVRVVNAAPPSGQEALPFWRHIGEALGVNIDLLENSITGELAPADGQWMDVRFEPDRADTYRHHNVGQPLHSDSAYVDPRFALEIALFYLARQAESGGESLFVDAETVAACARGRDSALYHRLTTMPVRFGKGNGAGRITPILHAEDGVTKINWNYYRVLPDQGDAIATLREDFFVFLEDMVARGDVASFRLAEGDAVFFRDEEVLHGRRAFAAKESGDRLLWKTYFSKSKMAAERAA